MSDALDSIIRDPDRCIYEHLYDTSVLLVGLRTNEPAKGKWFVLGGVVGKNERLADAFARIVKLRLRLRRQLATRDSSAYALQKSVPGLTNA
jgi:colanic acid biosynthesis protein WcaH